MSTATLSAHAGRNALHAALVSPVVVIFLSSNLVNVGNLVFNMVFSRWMGPELFAELALLLTIKLTILGVLGAAQMAVAQRIAAEAASERAATEQVLARANRLVFNGLLLLVPPAAAAALLFSGALPRGADSIWPMLILLAAMPFSGSLCMLRGVVTGRLDVRSVVLSANLEMGVRLIGAIFAWQAGLGLPGVTAALSLSIVAGWAVIARALPRRRAVAPDFGPIRRALALSAVPFAALQVGQVVLLDGDVIIANIALSATEAGYVAALSLFQRIQFFACFGLAVILLPAVAGAFSRGEPVLRAAAPAAALFGAVSLVVVTGAVVMPETLIALLVGNAFAPAAPVLWLACGAAAAFTFSYLAATFLAGSGDRSGIWCLAAAAPVQIAALAFAGAQSGADLSMLLSVKAVCQAVLALLLTGLLVRRLSGRGTAAPIDPSE